MAELRIAVDLVRRGYKVAFPYGEDWEADLLLFRDAAVERVQVKYVCSDGRSIVVRCRHQSLTGGKVRVVRRYTAETVDWLAVYDEMTDGCYYLPAANGQRVGVRFAADYKAI